MLINIGAANDPTVLVIFFKLCTRIKVVFDSKELFLSNYILWQVTVIFKHADPNDAQNYTNWLCCCYGNILVYTFAGF